jgi:hypothetical protein
MATAIVGTSLYGNRTQNKGPWRRWKARCKPATGKLCTTYQQSRDNFTEQHVGELWTQCQHLAWWILMAGNDGFDLCSRGIFPTFMTTVTELMPYFCRFDVEKNFLGRPQGPG